MSEIPYFRSDVQKLSHELALDAEERRQLETAWATKRAKGLEELGARYNELVQLTAQVIGVRDSRSGFQSDYSEASVDEPEPWLPPDRYVLLEPEVLNTHGLTVWLAPATAWKNGDQHQQYRVLADTFRDVTDQQIIDYWSERE